MNKKGNALGFVAIILALTILVFFVVGTYMQECKSNRDCPDNAYCGTDHECHQYPDKILVKENNFLLILLAIGFVISGLVIAILNPPMWC